MAVIKPYSILNQCQRELRNCCLPPQAKQKVERSLITLKGLVIESPQPLPVLPTEEHRFEELHHLVRHACALGSGIDDLERLMERLADLTAALGSKTAS